MQISLQGFKIEALSFSFLKIGFNFYLEAFY
jgi:hypothetical protein